MLSYYQKKFYEETWFQVIFGLLVLGLVIYGIYYAVTYRNERFVTIEDRTWTYTLAVKYKRTTTKMKTEVSTSCSGSGDNYRCTTTTNLVPRTVTHTYTRCRDSNTGRELPPIRPLPPCSMRAGDYISEGVGYDIRFKDMEKDKPGHASISKDQWDDLWPGRYVRLVTNVLGSVTEYEAQ